MSQVIVIMGICESQGHTFTQLKQNKKFTVLCQVKAALFLSISLTLVRCSLSLEGFLIGAQMARPSSFWKDVHSKTSHSVLTLSKTDNLKLEKELSKYETCSPSLKTCRPSSVGDREGMDVA